MSSQHREQSPKPPDRQGADASKKSSPQEATKDPNDQGPKWPGGGTKGEDEKRQK